MKKTVKVERRFPSGEVGLLGTAVQTENGWKFYPNNQRRKSTKYHATMAQCLPRWLGGPDYFETREVLTQK